MSQLNEFDPEVWFPGFPRYIQKRFQPSASKDFIVTKHGSLCYRSIYYYSNNPEKPYVILKKFSNLKFPLVKCCDETSYALFLKSFMKGEFNDIGISVHMPDYCSFSRSLLIPHITANMNNLTIE